MLCRGILFYIILIAPVLTWDNTPELLRLALAITVVRVQSGSLAKGALLIRPQFITCMGGFGESFREQGVSLS